MKMIRTVAAGVNLGQLHEEISTIPGLEPIDDPAGTGDRMAVFQFVLDPNNRRRFALHSLPYRFDESLVDEKIAAHVPNPEHGKYVYPYTLQQIRDMPEDEWRGLVAQALKFVE